MMRYEGMALARTTTKQAKMDMGIMRSKAVGSFFTITGNRWKCSRAGCLIKREMLAEPKRFTPNSNIILLNLTTDVEGILGAVSNAKVC